MKKIPIIVCLVSLFALVGCGSKSTTTANSTTQNVTTQTPTTQGFVNPGDSLGGGETSNYDTNAVSLTQKTSNVKTITDNLTVDETAISTSYTNITAETTINTAGDYYITGNISGKIEVTVAGVHLFLNNATIENGKKVIESSEDLTITVIGTNSLINTNTSDTKNVISCSKNLTINGSGTLNITSVKSGIKADQSLKIVNATLNLICASHGISAESIYLKNTTLEITCTGDGIHAEIDYDDVAASPTYTNEKGYVVLENSNITINSVDDGIQADSFINLISGTLSITTNGGAPSTITETSSDNGSGKGLKAGQIDYLISETEYELESEDYGIIIDGGTLTVNSNDDALHSNGYLIINGGTLSISAGDDAIHSETVAEVNAGTINVNKSYEALESAKVQINGGTMELNATDDGINAADGTTAVMGVVNTNCHIIITGGTTHVNAQGDGVDSNGTILMTSGTLTIDGPTNGANGSLDTEGGFLLKGGTLVACGSLGMVETPAQNSTQYIVSFASKTSIEAGTILSIIDDNNETLISFTTTKQCQSVIMSSSLLENGKTYGIYGGSTLLGEFTISSIITSVGTATTSTNPGGIPSRR